MTRAQQAKEYFLQGKNCAQAVALAFADVIGNESFLLSATQPLGGGLGRLRQTCGAVSGGAVTLGLLFPQSTKAETYSLVQELARRFIDQNGSINCGELLTGVGIAEQTSPVPEERTKEYYKKRPCADLVYDAAQIVEAICLERGRL